MKYNLPKESATNRIVESGDSKQKETEEKKQLKKGDWVIGTIPGDKIPKLRKFTGTAPGGKEWYQELSEISGGNLINFLEDKFNFYFGSIDTDERAVRSYKEFLTDLDKLNEAIKQSNIIISKFQPREVGLKIGDNPYQFWISTSNDGKSFVLKGIKGSLEHFQELEEKSK